MTPYSCVVCKKRYRNRERKYITMRPEKELNACVECYKKVQAFSDCLILIGLHHDIIDRLIVESYINTK